MSAALTFTGITKRFFGVPVLRDVSFELPAGHTLGLVGENGAGKSTLMNILGGNLQPEGGTMRLEGRDHRPRSPHDARAAGIAFVHQELNLFTNLTIGENLFLTGFPATAGLIRRAEVRQRARALLDQVGLALSPDLRVESLPAGERQLVEIARALGMNPRLILFDEPTTSLTARETAQLFALMGRLRQGGVPMIYISHALGDVLRLCDDIVVLRDGVLVDAGPGSRFTVESLISRMVGREMAHLFPPRPGRADDHPPPRPGPGTPQRAAATGPDVPRPDAVRLEVRGVSQPGIVKEISLRVHRGELVGIAGLMGSGRTELARILFGLDPMASGSVELDGASIGHLGPRERIARGMAFLTEDRRQEGLFMEASIGDNITLASAPRRSRGPVGWLDRAALAGDVHRIRRAVGLTPAASDGQPARTLSGGNQQKVVLARWLLNDPKVFLLDEPTRGIDVGARYDVHVLIRQLAQRGAGVLMISSEIEELIGLCDRILVMSRGEIRDELRHDQFDRERILRAAVHGDRLAPGEGRA